MRHSIRKQFAIIFITLMAGTIGLCWIINTLFLQDYYVKNKQKILVGTYDKLNELFNTGDYKSDEFGIEFSKICNTNNLNVVVVDSSLNTILSSVSEEEMLVGRLMDHLFRESASETGSVSRNEPPPKHSRILVNSDNYMIKLSADPRMQTDYIELWGSMDNGDIIIMRTALESIRESVAISNRFLTYVGLAAIVLCGIIIWLVSTRITKPILELADISEKMTHLDFDAKYTSGGKNEIAILGEHINQLSDTLEHTISELKTANNELQCDIKKREEIDDMRKEFLSNVSHELKTPIALIQGYAEGLKEEINEDSESREYYLEVIMDEADKMNSMVKSLMTLNQLESGNDTICMERFDITEMVRNCIQSADILIKQAEIEVFFEEKESFFAWADEFKTEEVFMNYLSNAIHYAEGEKKIEVTITKLDGKVRVSVFNTGKPIPENAVDKLWTKFYKVDKARTREYGGSGVGLSIVKAIMDSFHQKFGLQNYDNGVAFWFELDCK